MPVRKITTLMIQPLPPVFVGIDPGVSGGVACIQGQKVLKVQKMPATEGDVWELLEEVSRLCNSCGGFVYLEQQTPRPTNLFDRETKKFRPTILKSTCLLYGSYKLLKGMLVASGLPHEEHPPQRWQKTLNIVPRSKDETETAWKNRLKAKAQSLFPGVKITLATADALLIAECARRSRIAHGNRKGERERRV